MSRSESVSNPSTQVGTAPLSCDHCRLRKKKCDRQRPCLACVLGSQACTYREPQRRGPNAGWVQRCLDRAQECEVALAAVLSLPGVMEQVVFVAEQEGSSSSLGSTIPNLLQTSRSPSHLQSQWQSLPLDTWHQILSFSQQIESSNTGGYTAGPHEDSPRGYAKSQYMLATNSPPSRLSDGLSPDSPPRQATESSPSDLRFQSQRIQDILNSSPPPSVQQQQQQQNTQRRRPRSTLLEVAQHSQHSVEISQPEDEDFW